MPPKVKVNKEDIVTVALDVVRREGASALNARTVAAALGCSTQPVFSNFATMEELRFAVAEKATLLYDARTAEEVAKAAYPPYKASGMAYIRFAKEERELFKLLFMCDRTGESIPEGAGSFERMTALVHGNTGLQEEAATLFHLEMWAYVHGIATMYATKFLDLDEELVSRMLTDAYQGLRKQYGTE